MKEGYVYIMTNHKNGTLYIWVTSNLSQRIYEHREWIRDGFTKKYNLPVLVYYEICPSIESAILREKQLKWWNRKQKIILIESDNKEWNDLYDTIVN